MDKNPGSAWRRLRRGIEMLEATEQERFSELSAFIDRAIGDGAFPGATWGIAQHGQVLTVGAAGRFTYNPQSDAVTPGTAYDLASVSKVVATTAMAMLLYQQGLLSLDMPVGDLLPGFVVASERGSRRHLVTLGMLLAHTSGLPGYAPLFAEYPNAPALLRACLQLPLSSTPGSRAEYSDIGFILLGKALELLAGVTLERFCEQNIFEPLAMSGTRYKPPVKLRASIPPTELDELFRQRGIQGEVHDENCWVLGGCAGHAGVFAPAGDLLLFAEAMLAPLRPETGGDLLFAADAVRLFTTRAALPAESSRALGWDTPSPPSSSGTSFSPRSFGHLGYTGTSLWLDPERDLAVVLLANRTWPTRENKQIQQVRPAFHDLVVKLL